MTLMHFMRTLLLNCCLVLTFWGPMAAANPPTVSTALKQPGHSLYVVEAFDMLMGIHPAIRDTAPFLSFYVEKRNLQAATMVVDKSYLIDSALQVEALRLVAIADAAIEKNLDLALAVENQADLEALRTTLNGMDFCSQTLR